MNVNVSVPFSSGLRLSIFLLILISTGTGSGTYLFSNVGLSPVRVGTSLPLPSSLTVTVMSFLSASVFAYVHPAGASSFVSSTVNTYVPSAFSSISAKVSVCGSFSFMSAVVETVSLPLYVICVASPSFREILKENGSAASAPVTFFVTFGVMTAGRYSFVYVTVKFAFP